MIDFGESYEAMSPPKDLGIPQVYCPPEAILDKTAGIGGDILTLACTIFEIRTGKKLFDSFDDDPDEHLCNIVAVLGPLSEPQWTTWEARKTYFEDDADNQGRAILKSEIKAKSDEPRSIREKLSEGVRYTPDWPGSNIRRDIPQDEIEVFADLLGKLLMYSPDDRISARAALEHEWFKI